MIHLPLARKIVRPRPGPVQLFGLSGRLRSVFVEHDLTKVPKDGANVLRYLNHNILVQDFLATVPLSFFQARAAYVTQLGVGSGLTNPSDTDSALAAEVMKKAITEPLDEDNLTGATPYVIAMVQFLPGQANGDLSEAALFLSTNVMINRALFGRESVVATTQTNPVGVESTGHGLQSGQRLRFDSVTGMTQLNYATNGNTYYYADVQDADNFDLYTDSTLLAGLDGSGFGSPGSGGTWTLVHPKGPTNSLFASFEMQAQNV